MQFSKKSTWFWLPNHHSLGFLCLAACGLLAVSGGRPFLSKYLGPGYRRRPPAFQSWTLGLVVCALLRSPSFLPVRNRACYLSIWVHKSIFGFPCRNITSPTPHTLLYPPLATTPSVAVGFLRVRAALLSSFGILCHWMAFSLFSVQMTSVGITWFAASARMESTISWMRKLQCPPRFNFKVFVLGFWYQFWGDVHSRKT